MNRRYIGRQPQSFMDLPWLGVVEPRDVLSGIAADAVASRPDFEDVEESDSAELPSAEDSEGSGATPVDEVPAKPRRPSPKPASGS